MGPRHLSAHLTRLAFFKARKNLGAGKPITFSHGLLARYFVLQSYFSFHMCLEGDDKEKKTPE